MGIDKTIRLGVETGDASGKINDLRSKVGEANAESISQAKELINLLRQRGVEEDELYRKKIRNTQAEIQASEREFQIWKVGREESSQERKDEGKSTKAFDAYTRKQELDFRRESLGEKGGLADLREEADTEKGDRKKQLAELAEILKKLEEGNKDQKNFFEKAGEAGTGGGGGVGGTGALLNNPYVKGAMMAIGIATAGAALAASSEKGIMSYAQNIRENPTEALLRVRGQEKRAAQLLGKSEAAFMNENYAKYQTAYGSSDLRGGIYEGYELAGAERVTGMSSQQIEKVLTMSRYSGASSTGQISTMENYLIKTNQSLVRLPEIMESYLQTANQVLQKTGEVDPISLQRSMQSIGGSYGAQGVNLERMIAGFQTMGTFSQNPIMLALQQQTLRKLFPGMSQWDKMKISEDPLGSKEGLQYMQALVSRLKRYGGGGDFAKFALKEQLGDAFSAKDIEKIFKGDMKIADIKAGKEGFYTEKTKGMVGGGEQILAEIKDTGNAIYTEVSNLLRETVKGTDFINSMSPGGEKYEQMLKDSERTQQRAIENGMKNSAKYLQ